VKAHNAWSLTVGSTLILIALSTSVAWSQDATLCNGIAEVMRHQPAGFRDIKAKPAGTRFESKLWLSGATDCWIGTFKDARPLYACSWRANNPITIELELRRYADHTASCFPGTQAAYSRDEGDLDGEFEVKGIHFLWLLDRKRNLIGLTID
jgi:hypothetical protein